MLTNLTLKNFKSWQNTGPIRLAPLTGLFGPNSSGKTSLLQFLLILKQTAEIQDRARVLHLGNSDTYVDVGTYYDLIYDHDAQNLLDFALTWQRTPLTITDPERKSATLFTIDSLQFQAQIGMIDNTLQVHAFEYQFDDKRFGMERQASKGNGDSAAYSLICQGYNLRRNQGRGWPLPRPVKSYGFPDQVNAYYQNAGFLAQIVFAFEQLWQTVYYLGPLREYPSRHYVWAGEQPQDVGRRGEQAIAALLASRNMGQVVKRGKGKKRQTIEECVAMWLQKLGLIHSFRLVPIAEHRKEYEVRVRRSPRSPEVLITDVGFGVSQILPVLVLCYYAPEGATLILEQPEIHLHPSVQAGLADVFIDAITTRNIQIILESHSEHLLRRLQRRIAEAVLTPAQTALYFTDVSEAGTCQLRLLELDGFGNIQNWPAHFFGDEVGDLIAMTEAAMHRQTKANGETA